MKKKKKAKKQPSWITNILQHPDITAYFDGACAPINPSGTMGMGAYILEQDTQIFSDSQMIEAQKGNSNNVAEYLALEMVLDFLLENGYNGENILVMGDSRLVINQMRGQWKISEGYYKEVALRCKDKVRYFTNIKFEWIPREKNTLADELSNKKLNEAGIKPFEKKQNNKITYKQFSKRPLDYSKVVMPFGKHKGVCVKDVPTEYLLWCKDNWDKIGPTVNVLRYIKEEFMPIYKEMQRLGHEEAVI